VGFGVDGIHPVIHIPLAMMAGAVAGGLFGLIPGLLKAYTGAHEVITCIMLNYVAINSTDFLVNGLLKDPAQGNIIARTPLILDSSRIPAIHHIPLGFLIAVFTAVVVWWLIKYAVIGFEIRTVGINIHAARYAGIRVAPVLAMTMLVSGCLAGLGGAIETQGVVYRFQPGFNMGLGFDGITVALLARAHPIGVVPAALLIGAMEAGAGQMQFNAGVANEIVDVIQALMLFFVAADMLIRWLITGRKEGGDGFDLSAGWGKL
jgi:simple sugar transport system permease protein